MHGNWTMTPGTDHRPKGSCWSGGESDSARRRRRCAGELHENERQDTDLRQAGGATRGSPPRHGGTAERPRLRPYEDIPNGRPSHRPHPVGSDAGHSVRPSPVRTPRAGRVRGGYRQLEEDVRWQLDLGPDPGRVVIELDPNDVGVRFRNCGTQLVNRPAMSAAG